MLGGDMPGGVNAAWWPGDQQLDLCPVAGGEQAGAERVLPGAEYGRDPRRVGQRVETRVERVPAGYGNRIGGPVRGDQADPRGRQRAERRIEAIWAERYVLTGGQAG